MHMPARVPKKLLSRIHGELKNAWHSALHIVIKRSSLTLAMLLPWGRKVLSFRPNVTGRIFIDAILHIDAAAGKSFADETDAVETFVKDCGCLLFSAGEFVLELLK